MTFYDMSFKHCSDNYMFILYY